MACVQSYVSHLCQNQGFVDFSAHLQLVGLFPTLQSCRNGTGRGLVVYV